MSVRINLLPIRAAKRQSNARQELYYAAAAVIASVVVVYFYHSWTQSETAAVRAEVNRLRTELAGLKKERDRVKEFDEKNKTLEGKRDAIKRLEAQRSGPARLLDDLATVMTQEPKVWLTELKESNGRLVLKGEAMENINISDFQVSLRKNSNFVKGLDSPGALKKVTMKKDKGFEFLQWEMECRADYGAGVDGG